MWTNEICYTVEYPDHTARIPAGVRQTWDTLSRGIQIETAGFHLFPFQGYYNAAGHWGIAAKDLRGSGANLPPRFECDDSQFNNGGFNQDTLHNVWVRLKENGAGDAD